jgi:hypothetical protein
LAWAFGLAGLLVFSAECAVAPASAPSVLSTKGDFQNQAASPAVQAVARWVSDSRDNHGLPYVIVDKVDARVFVFDAQGRLRGADAALLGMARGDGSVPGIGDQKMSTIRPDERTTPAGRFKASLDHDVHGAEILVIDYAASISLHAVVKGTPAERRAERLASATSADNRISYGCINVPLKFYKKVVSPVFTQTFGIVYILPEMSSASALFGFQDTATDPRKPDLPRVGQGVPVRGTASETGIRQPFSAPQDNHGSSGAKTLQ